jgi:hypothetical protein
MAHLSDSLHGAVPAELLTRLDTILARADYDDGVELVTSGALSVTKRTSKISIDGTKAYTLADGTFVGQIKVIICTVAANTPAGTVTPVNIDVGSSLAFNATNDACVLVWDGTNWLIQALNSVSVS